jgi:hypothetical protein
MSARGHQFRADGPHANRLPGAGVISLTIDLTFGGSFPILCGMKSFNLDGLPGSLLTTGNPKVAKGEAHGVLTAIMHLAPEMKSGRNVCPHATAGCAAACLNTAGRGGIGLDADGLNTIQAARIQRTRWFHRNRADFLTALVAEVARHERSARKHGLTAAVRLNGTSDLPWERFPVVRDGVEYPHIFAAFPEVTFYDYTKWPVRLRPLVSGIPNYSLTYSLADGVKSETEAGNALEAGINVAAVFAVKRGAPLPAWHAVSGVLARVIDGDATDLRFRDPREDRGVIVGLRAKGDAKGDATGFVRQP